MKTTYERGIEDGIERGIERGIEQGERRSALRQMEAKFGPLSAEVKQRVEALSPEGVARLQLDLLEAQALEELRLGPGNGSGNGPGRPGWSTRPVELPPGRTDRPPSAPTRSP
jgi:Domain of unknown function (DUF4351)